MAKVIDENLVLSARVKVKLEGQKMVILAEFGLLGTDFDKLITVLFEPVSVHR